MTYSSLDPRNGLIQMNEATVQLYFLIYEAQEMAIASRPDAGARHCPIDDVHPVGGMPTHKESTLLLFTSRLVFMIA
jgi:hypothetical protein